MRLRTFWLVLLALAATLLVACGSDDADDISDAAAQEVLQKTFGPEEPVSSGVLDLSLGLDAKGLQDVSGPVTVKLKGPFQSQGDDLPKFDLDASLTAAGQTIQGGAISTGDKGYLVLRDQTFDLGSQVYGQLKSQYKADQARSAKEKKPTFSTLGIDPNRWLSDPAKVGEETVAGTRTEHVKASVDVPKLLDDVNRLLGKAGQLGVPQAAGQQVPQSLTAAQRQQIQQSVTSTALDVWADKSGGALRQLKLAVGFSVPKAAQARANGLQSGTLTLNLGIDDLNEDQSIPEPTGARPLSDLTGAATGGTTGSAGTADPGAGTTDSGTAAADPNPKYTACLQQAAGDIAKVRACGPLLNGG